ncbi:cytochrome P450 2K1-like [Latimeria chalumnae]
MEVIGCERSAVSEDRKDMPYTNAVMYEIQRFANIVPMGLPHQTSTDVHFRGYFLPKETQIIPLLTSVLYDKTQWEKPEEFYPSHFLDAEGKFVKKDAFMPFSAGRRICVGENLAKMEFFLFFVTLLQIFKFSPPPGVTERDLDLTPCFGVTSSPVPYKLCAVPY